MKNYFASLVFVVCCLSLTGCGNLLVQKSKPKLPDPVVPPGWTKYEIAETPFVLVAPEGWEFKSLKGNNKVGGGLFAPEISVPSGRLFVMGQRLDEKSLKEGGAGFISIERKEADSSLPLETLAEKDKSPFDDGLMGLLGGEPQITKEIIDFPVGKFLRIKKDYGQGAISVDYFTAENGSMTKFSFTNLSDAANNPIPSRDIMEALRYR